MAEPGALDLNKVFKRTFQCKIEEVVRKNVVNHSEDIYTAEVASELINENTREVFSHDIASNLGNEIVPNANEKGDSEIYEKKSSINEQQNRICFR